MKSLILASRVVEKYLTVELAVETVDFVFREWGRGGIDMPAKVHVDMSGIGHEAWCNAMPAYIDQQKTGGLKWVGGFGNNPAGQLPYIMGVVLLTDPADGRVKSIMDGRMISDYRTGASAAVFARYLAVRALERILIVGAGAQGQMAACCLHAVYPDAKIRMHDLQAEKVTAFREKHLGSSLADALELSTDLEQATREAQLAVLLTTARQPIIRDQWISPGTTVLGMGTYQQIEPAFTLGCDKLVTDYWEQALGRSELKPLVEQGQMADTHPHLEIGQIAAGHKPGRENERERILGLPLGLGAHDVAIGNIIYEKALAHGDGIAVELQET